ncbi:YheC/YheD family protein [Alicyclobacillus tolerans]|uniref:YheC/YheD family endospore coat-associated protein n=1 Tax=Alicyclobacillus tolerans TaxID=90970 RepID=UPI001F486C33|nr:YheC/YheD family protein [Alicyclobacillus tolerans]MCF8564838.1 YheC/YheD family protein [Alicyclobacillus tolerans]
MSAPLSGELVWYRRGGETVLAVSAPTKVKRDLQTDSGSKRVKVSNSWISWMPEGVDGKVVYRAPIRLQVVDGEVSGGPVFAILAASGGTPFRGTRTDFRDLLAMGREYKKFLYVIPDSHVTNDSRWIGYVRIGYQRWMALPCPRPQAVYNRIPFRNLEHTPSARLAKRRLSEFEIPMFNPEYFNKAVIYNAVKSENLAQYLPETTGPLTEPTLAKMLLRNQKVYLKPAGGSIGHGMILVERVQGGYKVSVSKSGQGSTFRAPSMPAVWRLVQQQRVPGMYVIQAAKNLLKWKNRPCDFRVLLQKHRGRWHLIGKGVRVAGENSITTHVPNGGFIASAKEVLQEAFADRADAVEGELNDMVIQFATAIDRHYQEQLGEMSMDIGIDPSGQPWFFEANAKPMKFDEPDIRRKSLLGIIARLEELSKP